MYKTLDYIHVYNEYNHVYKLDDVVSFQWFKNSHCVGAVQIQLILGNKSKTKKILYTSDIGALDNKNHYVTDTEIPEVFSDITIMESTYGSPKRTIKKTRNFDVEHFL